jgi:hypothetical protein
MENASFGLQAASYGSKEQGKRLMNKGLRLEAKITSGFEAKR